MAVKLTKFGGTQFSDGDVLDDDELNDTIGTAGNYPRYQIIYDSSINGQLIKFDAATWQTAAKTTTDSGATWAGSGLGAASLVAATFTGGYGAQSTSAGVTKYTTDSGSTWNAPSTAPPNITAGLCMSMGSTTVGVLGGTAGAGNYIWYTSNSGDDWSQATTGPTANVRAISMASSTVGYAVDSAGNIWKTTDSGVNWTDTTDNFNIAVFNIIATDTDTVYANNNDQIRLEKYVNSTNTVTTLLDMQLSDGTESGASNLVEATNGSIYFIFHTVGNNQNGSQTLVEYDGSDIWLKPLCLPSEININHIRAATHTYPSLIEVSDKLYFNMNDMILEINEVV